MQLALRKTLSWLAPIVLLNTLFLQQSHVLDTLSTPMGPNPTHFIQNALDWMVIRGLGVAFIDNHVSDPRWGNIIGIDGTALVCILVLVILGHRRWAALGRTAEVLRTLQLLSLVGLPLGIENLIGGRFVNWTVGTFQQFLPYPLSAFSNLDFMFTTVALLILTTVTIPFRKTEGELFLRVLNE